MMADLLRKAMDLARKIDSVPLYQVIIELQQDVLALQDEKARSDEENRTLKSQLHERDERDRRRAALVFRDGVYRHRDGGDGDAYCPRCFDADGKAVHLAPLANGVLCCQNCKAQWIPTSRQRDAMDAIHREDYPEPRLW